MSTSVRDKRPSTSNLAMVEAFNKTRVPLYPELRQLDYQLTGSRPWLAMEAQKSALKRTILRDKDQESCDVCHTKTTTSTN